jgi:hypothetical protein
VPTLEQVSAEEAAVGEPLQFSGSGFIDPEEGWTELTFRGEFMRAGVAEPVVLTVQVLHDDHETLSWRVGPYRVPFTATGDAIGTFVGDVVAANVTNSGLRRRQETAPLPIEVRILPSLVVRDVEAVGEGWASDCRYLNTRFINHVPYRISFQAIGFEPETFVYTIAEGLFDETTGPQLETTTIEHQASGSIDMLGELEELRFAEVPLAAPVYRTSVSATALDREGRRVTLFLMLTVHQPLHVRYLPGSRIAQLMDPIAVTGCITGGKQGKYVTYRDQKREIKNVTTSQSLRTGWSQSYTDGHTETYGEGAAVKNRVHFKMIDQTRWQWDVGLGGSVSGGVNLGFVGKGTMNGGAKHKWGGKHTDTRSGQLGWRNSVQYSGAADATRGLLESSDTYFEDVWSTTSTTTNELYFHAFLLPNHWGVFYRQAVRLAHDAEIVAYDLCGNETVVGQFTVTDYTWTPDLSMAASCPPFPDSQLPAAECFEPPCVD